MVEDGLESTSVRATLRRLLFGDEGLRAGWSIALFLIFVLVISAGENRVIAHWHLLPKPTKTAEQAMLTPRMPAITEGLTAGTLLLAAFLVSLVERRPFARYGLGLKRALPDFLVGLVWGFVTLSVLIGLLLASHAIVFTGVLLHGTVAWAYAGKWAVVFLLVGLLEEFLFRGFLVATLTRGLTAVVQAVRPGMQHPERVAFWISAGVFSIVLFAVTHLGNGGETALGITSVALVGTVFAFALYRTGTLWWLIGYHAAWDWAQSYFYGTPDSGQRSLGRLLDTHAAGATLLSGGTAGPEGSVWILPTLLLTAAIIHFTLPKRQAI